MYDLIQVGNKTFYLDCPTNVGFYIVNEKDVFLIDSGNDKETGKKISKIISEKNWNLKTILNTHSHADHAGGNKFLQDKYNCDIYTIGFESVFLKNPILEPSFLFGGFPPKDICNKFLMPSSSFVKNIEDFKIPNGLSYFNLEGHAFNMIGFKTSDDIYFLSDSIFSEKIINKYHLFFIIDIEEFFLTLDKLENMEGKLFIPSHCEPIKDNVKELVKINRNKVFEIIERILIICKEKRSFEDILKEVFDCYDLRMDFNQYVLVGNTLKSYLSYLYNKKKIKIFFENNKLLWQI